MRLLDWNNPTFLSIVKNNTALFVVLHVSLVNILTESCLTNLHDNESNLQAAGSICILCNL